MKVLKPILLWSILAVCIQVGGLFFLNNYYWKSKTTFDIKPAEVKKTPTKQQVDIDVPTDAKDIQVSYDGKYMSYILDEKITIVDTSTGTGKELSDIPTKAKISYYKWLPDRPTIIIAEKHIGTKKTTVNFSTYDGKTLKRKVITDNHYETAAISLPDSTHDINNITISTIIGFMYMSIPKADDKTLIYHMINMAQVEEPTTIKGKVGDMNILSTDNVLIYENLEDKKIFTIASTHKSKELNISSLNMKEPKLLGIDNNDNVYVGDIVNSKISKVYYGQVDSKTEKVSTWKDVALPQATSSKDILVDLRGKIFINDTSNKKIINVSTKKSTSYSGNFLSIFEDGVSSVDGSKYKSIEFTK